MFPIKRRLVAFVGLGSVVVAGTLVGLGFAGAFDVDGDAAKASVREPVPTATATPSGRGPATGVPNATPEPTPVTKTGPILTPEDVPAPTARPTPTPRSDASVSPTPTPKPTPAPSPTPARNVGPGDGLVAPDTDFEVALRRASFRTFGWRTDFSRHSVPYDEFLSGGPPRDGIPPIDNPKFVSPGEADQWLEGLEPVIFVDIEGDARAYPLQILTFHEIVNDEVGGIPVAVTFCPLCNSAITFDRRLGGVVYTFGTSGNLRNSDLVMWDRQTESWWQQFTGEAIVGVLTGKRLSFLAS